MERKLYIVYYEKHNNGVEICGIYNHCHGKGDYVEIYDENDILMLPTEIQGIPVTGIKDFWAMGYNRYHDEVTSKCLIIPWTYKNLGNKNFSGWRFLERVVLCCDSSAMREWNFAYCNNLRDVFCMNGSVYDYCARLPLAHSSRTYGCFDDCLGNISFHRFNDEWWVQAVKLAVFNKVINWLGGDMVITQEDWMWLSKSKFPFSISDENVYSPKIAALSHPITPAPLCKLLELDTSPLADYIEQRYHPDESKEYSKRVIKKVFEYVTDCCSCIWGGCPNAM